MRTSRWLRTRLPWAALILCAAGPPAQELKPVPLPTLQTQAGRPAADASPQGAQVVARLQSGETTASGAVERALGGLRSEPLAVSGVRHSGASVLTDKWRHCVLFGGGVFAPSLAATLRFRA